MRSDRVPIPTVRRHLDVTTPLIERTQQTAQLLWTRTAYDGSINVPHLLYARLWRAWEPRSPSATLFDWSISRDTDPVQHIETHDPLEYRTNVDYFLHYASVGPSVLRTLVRKFIVVFSAPLTTFPCRFSGLGAWLEVLYASDLAIFVKMITSLRFSTNLNSRVLFDLCSSFSF